VRFGDSQRSDQLVKLEVTEAYPVLEVVTEIFVFRKVLEFKPVTVNVRVDPTGVPMLKVP
jgi:hypothetical protein